MKVIIVGGVAGGASAAARLRRLDENAQITMYERSGYISYANCGLPYYIGGVITDRRQLTLQTPDSFYKRFRVDVKVNHEVLSIDRVNHTVKVKNLSTGEIFTDNYDKLVLSPGAKAVKPPIPGIESERIFTLRTVEDTYRIADEIKALKAESAVVIGGGFIGIEAAENLTGIGLSVSLCEASPQVLSQFDDDMIPQVHAVIREKGINLILGRAISSFEEKEDRIESVLSDGEHIKSDIVLLAIGVAPDSALAVSAGIKTGIKGAITVDEHMLTSDPDIYAVGDAAEIEELVTGSKANIPLAGPANKQGRIAADNIAGISSSYKGTMGTSVLKIFDITAASTGINERRARAMSLKYDKVILSPSSHASYYPGGKVMTMKVLFDPDKDRLLGAQIIGYDGVDKRIDVIATALRAGMRASELAALELAYAPPYSSAKDPVNMAGFIIENVINQKVRHFFYDDIPSLQKKDDAFLLDTRTMREYSAGHAPGFINIPVDELRERLNEVPCDKTVYVMCQSGLRSYIACRILSAHGYRCFNFAGGYRLYSSIAGEKVINSSSYDCGMDKKALQ